MDRDALAVFATQVLALVLLSFDIAYDLAEGVALTHIIVELLAIFVMAVVIFRGLIAYYRKVKTSSMRMEQQIDSFRSEAEAWKAEASHYLKGLVAKIDQQFDTWSLSSAEKDIALLLIKGYSIKEIAALRDTSEKTIKQQNFSIYKKSNLAGRNELAAFFLEDLLLPSSTGRPLGTAPASARGSLEADVEQNAT